MAAEVAEAASSAQEFGGGYWIGQKRNTGNTFQAKQKGGRQRWQNFRGLLSTKRARWASMFVEVKI